MLATESKPFTAFIDTDHTSFISAEDLPAAITKFCQSTGQKAPQTHGEFIRTILEGLALKFKIVISQIEQLRGAKPEAIYLTGEGIATELLSQFTAGCCGISVLTTTDEFVIPGNILLQAQALGIVKNVAEIREISGKSFPSKTFQPLETEVWDEAFDLYLQLAGTM